jgi:hypothetical protein
MKIYVRKQRRGYAVYIDGVLVEGGFFTRGAAKDAADAWAREMAFTGLIS